VYICAKDISNNLNFDRTESSTELEHTVNIAICIWEGEAVSLLCDTYGDPKVDNGPKPKLIHVYSRRPKKGVKEVGPKADNK